MRPKVEAFYEEIAEKLEQEEKPARRRREPVQKERKPIKLTVPPVLKKVVKLYFPTAQEIREREELAIPSAAARSPSSRFSRNTICPPSSQAWPWF